MTDNLTFKEIREILINSGRCYRLWISRKNRPNSYCNSHKKHHLYWIYPLIEITPRPSWGFDTKKDLVTFVRKEFLGH